MDSVIWNQNLDKAVGLPCALHVFPQDMSPSISSNYV